MSGLAPPPTTDPGPNVVAEDCPTCDLTGAMACPSCNATGFLLIRPAAPAAVATASTAADPA